MLSLRRLLAIVLLALLALAPAAARAAGPAPQPYGTNSAKGFRNVLPPGTNGFDSGPELAQFLTTGKRPAHNNDQLGMYSNLIKVAPHLTTAQIPQFFKDSTFGVPAGQTAKTESPCPGVTIARDKAFGVPHIYGSTRAALMCGIGYATAEDRLFFIDVLRHVGRGQLSSFAGGAPGNRAMDAAQWATAPYTEPDLQAKVDTGQRYGAAGPAAPLRRRELRGRHQQVHRGRQAQPDAHAPGIRGDRQAPRPDNFKVTDMVAIASLVGGIFGRGGGNELPWAQYLQSLTSRSAHVAAPPRSATSATRTTPRRRARSTRSASPTAASQEGAQGQRRAPRPRLGPAVRHRQAARGANGSGGGSGGVDDPILGAPARGGQARAAAVPACPVQRAARVGPRVEVRATRSPSSARRPATSRRSS